MISDLSCEASLINTNKCSDWIRLFLKYFQPRCTRIDVNILFESLIQSIQRLNEAPLFTGTPIKIGFLAALPIGDQTNLATRLGFICFNCFFFHNYFLDLKTLHKLIKKKFNFHAESTVLNGMNCGLKKFLIW